MESFGTVSSEYTMKYINERIDQQNMKRMKTTNTFGVHFIIRMNKLRDNKAPVYSRVTVDGSRVEISLKKWVALNLWDTRSGRLRGNRTEARDFNYFLDQIKARLLECYQELQIQKKHITAEAIKNKFLGIDREDHTLCDVVSYHNKNFENALAPGTMKNYFTTQKYIKLFLEQKLGIKDILLSQLSYKFITDFEFFLRNFKPIDHHKPIANNGVMKHIERFRKIINLAVRMEWLDKDPFEKYSQKFEKVHREFLTNVELTRIEQHELPVARLQYIRDLFIFSCYTGLSYIDTMKLKPVDVSIGIDNDYWIFTKRQKTNIPVRVPLLPKAFAIIQKYKDNPRSLTHGTLFPIISNQKLNSYLKELADLCNINKNLTFHLARHTFATTITLSNGVPIESVSKMLGHTQIRTTQIYAKVIEQKISFDMKALKNKLQENIHASV